jgi:hypothetical protein
MKSRAIWALIGGSAVALNVVAAGAAAGAPQRRSTVRIPDSSIGWKKHSPQVRKGIAGDTSEPRPLGPAGPTAAPGSTGAPGQQAQSVPGIALTYSFKGGAQPVVFKRENGAFQESIGPLTFFASCVSEGEDTIRGRLTVTASQSGVTFDGQSIGQGEVKTVQELAVSGGSDESLAAVVKAVTEDGSVAIQGNASLLVSLPAAATSTGR